MYCRGNPIKWSDPSGYDPDSYTYGYSKTGTGSAFPSNSPLSPEEIKIGKTLVKILKHTPEGLLAITIIKVLKDTFTAPENPHGMGNPFRNGQRGFARGGDDKENIYPTWANDYKNYAIQRLKKGDNPENIADDICKEQYKQSGEEKYNERGPGTEQGKLKKWGRDYKKDHDW